MNQLTVLEPREKPLTVEAFEKIEEVLHRHFEVKTLTAAQSVPKVDAQGEIYGWEIRAVPVGVGIKAKGEVDTRIVDAVQRPATKAAINFHLTKLSAHKRTTQGGMAFKIILSDAERDLEGCSEWAVMKAYDKLRNEPGDFFPSLKTIVDTVKWFDAGARSMGNTPAKHTPLPVTPKEDRTEGKYRVASVMHKAGIPHDKEFCRECGA